MAKTGTARRAKGPSDDDAVVKPRRSKLDPGIYDPAIFCPVGPMLSLAARLLGAKASMMPFEPGRVYTARHLGRRITLAGPAMGAPAAAYTLERLIANGVKHVVMLGLCGSLNRKVRIGDLVVPDWGIIGEGTSNYYVPDARRSSPTNAAVSAVRDAVSGSGKSHHLGPVYTTDAVFRETVGLVKACGNKDVLAIEMEASAMFTVARYRKIELAALLVVSDELFDLRWKQGFTRPRFLAALRHSCHIARRACFNMMGWDLKERVSEEDDKSEPLEDDPAEDLEDDGGEQ